MKLPKLFNNRIDHFFGKATVVTCIGFIILYCIVFLYGHYKLGIESTHLTPFIFSFFGTELAIMAFKTIFEKKSSNKSDDNKMKEVVENE